jgi:hypothetical protein
MYWCGPVGWVGFCLEMKRGTSVLVVGPDKVLMRELSPKGVERGFRVMIAEIHFFPENNF